MSTEIERRVGNLLNNSNASGAVKNSDVSDKEDNDLSLGAEVAYPAPTTTMDSAKDKLSLELKERQEKLKVLLLSLVP